MRLEGGRMQTTIWHLDGVERAVAEFGRGALDVDQSMGVVVAGPSFRENQFERRLTESKTTCPSAERVRYVIIYLVCSCLQFPHA